MKIPKTLDEVDYDLELDKVASEIKKQKSKRVLIQLPDGLKPFGTLIIQKLKEKTKNSAEIFLWFDTCFGACDIPLETEKLGIDLIVQFGHSNWNFKNTTNKKSIKIVK